MDEDLFKNPRPIQILRVNADDHTFTLNINQLSQILLDERVADCDCAVVSVAGAFRKGKSFLLDYILRFLEHDSNDSSSSPAAAWLGAENEPLRGFHWKLGSERDTTGIYMWSKPFITTHNKNSQKPTAIWLLDTQGTFDQFSTVKDWTRIFAISTMLSSVQIFNVSGNIQEDDLQHLQMFADYGRLALHGATKETSITPFQTLLFLVRDWMNPYEFDYGFAGGSQLLNKRLAMSKKQPFQLSQLRRHLRFCFDNIEAFLMPHPGLTIAEKKFDGRLSQLDRHFKQQLLVLIPGIFSPENLIPKMVNSVPVSSRDLFEYFKTYVNVFQTDTLPEPRTVFEATAVVNNMQAFNLGLQRYKTLMTALVCNKTAAYLHPELLQAEHDEALRQAVMVFDSVPKMGGNFYGHQCAKNLQDEAEKEFERYREINNKKVSRNSGFFSPTNTAVAAVLLTVSTVAAPFIPAASLVYMNSAFFGARFVRAAIVGLSVLLIGFKYKISGRSRAT